MNGRNRQARPSERHSPSAGSTEGVHRGRDEMFQSSLPAAHEGLGVENFCGRGSRVRHGNAPGSRPTRFAVKL